MKLGVGAINQSINQHELAMAPHIQSSGRQKYNENTTASQCHNNDSGAEYRVSH